MAALYYMMKVDRKISGWLPLVLWMAVIFHFSTGPQLPGPAGYAGGDISYLHVPIYFVLSALFLRMFLGGRGAKSCFIIAVAFSTIYGIVMEVFQYFLPDRIFSLADVGLNFAGSCLVFIFASRVLRKLVLMKSQNYQDQ